MPVDSIHAVIEKHSKHSIVQAPAGWGTFIKNSMINPKPYIVTEPIYTDLLDFMSMVSKIPLKFRISDMKIATFFNDNFKLVYLNSFRDAKEYSTTLELKKGSVPNKFYNTELPINQKNIMI